MKDTKELKGFTKVRLKDDNKVYFIHTIYNDKELSLCIRGYDDTEQDFITKIEEIKEGFK